MDRLTTVLRNIYRTYFRVNVSRRALLRQIFRFRGGLRVRGAAMLSYFPDSLFGENQRTFLELVPRFERGQRANNGGDLQRLCAWVLNLDHVLRSSQVPGDVAEVGVYQGNTASALAIFAKQHGRTCWLFDTYQGFSSKDLVGVDALKATNAFDNTSESVVRHTIGPEQIDTCRFVAGYFPQSIPDDCRSRTFSVVSLDCDLYQPIRDGLEFFVQRMAPGGIILVHDYAGNYWPGVKKALDEFCAMTGHVFVILPDKSGTACLRIPNKPATNF